MTPHQNNTVAAACYRMNRFMPTDSPAKIYSIA
jgi:hypothetical protein